MSSRRLGIIDQLFGEIDNIIKTLTVPPRPARALPAGADPDGAVPILPEHARAESVRLMRVNHSGEVAAQALYRGQALTARDSTVKSAMLKAADEERDHLAWCQQRLTELRGRSSALNALWYTGSFAIGALAGVLGERATWGFIAETEKQVESHLLEHLTRLSPDDTRSRAILAQMCHDEREHGATAASMGGQTLPWFVSLSMRATSRLMTKGSYWL